MPVITTHALAKIFEEAHNAMRSIDGMQSQEAFDELLKFLLVRVHLERHKRLSETDLSTRPPSHYVFNAFLAEALDARMIPAASMLKFDRFLSSEKSLGALTRIFARIRLSELPFDIRSEAIKEFMKPDLRRGLGMFLTPDPVVKLLVDLVRPKADERLLDPACGTGSFLLAAAHACRKSAHENRKMKLSGFDKNPRMLLLAQMNLSDCDWIEFDGVLQDSLAIDETNPNRGRHDGFDVILTNPPFGVVVDQEQPWLDHYSTSHATRQQSAAKIPSEVLFVERSLQLLKPGGRMGVVLPRGVMTNLQLDAARAALGKLGIVEAAVTLPPETFATTGTQTSTIVMVIKKYPKPLAHEKDAPIVFADVRNVGFDLTGRPRLGSELVTLAADLKKAQSLCEGVGLARLSTPLSPPAGFSVAGFLTQQAKHYPLIKTVSLGELVCSIGPGRTPRREEYTDNGVFLVKVGNLTGNGISWLPRERNFLDANSFAKLRSGAKYLLNQGDILLTASAHSADYIARKVDIVSAIPGHLKAGAAFVGEVMRLRPDTNKVDPYLLLAFLRLPSTTQRIQSMVRGQTAHLYADDLANLEVPESLCIEPSAELMNLAEIIREEARIAEDLNRVALAQEEIFERDRTHSLSSSLTTKRVPELR